MQVNHKSRPECFLEQALKMITIERPKTSPKILLHLTCTALLHKGTVEPKISGIPHVSEVQVCIMAIGLLGTHFCSTPDSCFNFTKAGNICNHQFYEGRPRPFTSWWSQ